MKSQLALFGVPVLLAFALSPSAPLPAVAAVSSVASPALEWTTGAVGTLPGGGLNDKVYVAGEHVIDLEQEGDYDPALWVVVLDYNTLTIKAGATVRFANHHSNAPVVIRAVGEIVIDGTLNLDGAGGQGVGAPGVYSVPGPGGFRGGSGHTPGGETSHSAGHGPGGGFLPSQIEYHGGSGSHATIGAEGTTGLPGPAYGPSSAMPLRGGSGGGGAFDFPSFGIGGGGAGGGGVLIGSNFKIRLSASGVISARGGQGGLWPLSYWGGGGSGGTIRLVSPQIVFQGGVLDARGGWVAPSLAAGNGRIRVETVGTPGPITAFPAPSFAPLGEFLPTNLPTVRLLSWWDDSTGAWNPIDPDPTANITSAGAADELLMSAGQRTIRIEGRGVPLQASLRVRTTYTRGDAVIDSSHTMGEAGGTTAQSWTDVTIDFGPGVSTVQVRAVL